MFALLKQSDARAVRQVLRGRRDQFDTLVKRYLPAVYAVSYAQLRNHADAEDVAQEAFLAAFTSLHTLREPHKFEGWVVSMARRIAVHLRQKRQQENDAIGINAAEAVVVPDVAREELRQLLRQEIDRLDSDDREVLLLHYFTGKSVGEIAVALDTGREAAKKRLQRARQQLSDNLLRQVKDETKPEKDFRVQQTRIMGLVAAAVAGWGGSAAAGEHSAASNGPAKVVTFAAIAALAVGGAGYLTSRMNERGLLGPRVDIVQALEERISAEFVPTPVTPIADASSELGEGVLGNGAGASASLTGLWKACDNLGQFVDIGPAGDLLQLLQTGSQVSIYIPRNGGPALPIGSGTIEHGELSIIMNDGYESVWTGNVSGDDAVVIAGEISLDRPPTLIELMLTRLKGAELEEVEIWKRRRIEVEQLAAAIQAFYVKNGMKYPDSLALLDGRYLGAPQLAQSIPSRLVIYAPEGLEFMDRQDASGLRRGSGLLQANGTELVQSNKDSDDSLSHEEWLFIQEADKLALWPSFPASPPLLTISYTSPPMTLVCESAESPYVRRIDRTNRMACASRPRVPDGNVEARLVACVEKMKRLELVLRMFENEDTEKRLPGGWISVVPNYMSDTMLLTCPCLGEKDELGRVVSYDLLFPVLTFDELREVAHELDVEADSDARLLSEIPLLNENHECSNSGGSHVLFADGHVELLMRNEWEVRVAPFVDYAERYYAGL